MPYPGMPESSYSIHGDHYRHYDQHRYTMSRPQNVHFDYNARQQYAPPRPPKIRWPPRPRVDDEAVSLAQEFKPGPPDAGGREARSRGLLDQQPIILDADPHLLPPRSSAARPSRESETKRRYYSQREASTSSDESSGPDTPVDSDSEDESRNRDRRYVFIPQEGVEIPLTYDEPRTPIHGKTPQHQGRAVPERGRVAVPKLDTNLARAKSSHDVPVRLERERSPYRSVPKQRENPVHGDYLLSPEAMTPKPRNPEIPSHYSKQSQRTPLTAIHNLTERHQDSPQTPPKPSMPRQRSSMAYPGEGAAAMLSPTHNALRQDNFPSACRDGQRLECQTSTPLRRSSAVPSPTHSSWPMPNGHVRQSSVPPPSALPVSTDRAPAPSNPLSGFSGQQSLNAMLASPVLERRRASPRNSPSSSPLSSPPRTPPTETSNRKFNYVENTWSSGTNSRPASPLHPLPSKYPGHSDEVEPEHRRLRPAIRTRQTSPLPPAANGYLEANPVPRIDIRSPSPLVRNRSSSHSGRHERSRSQHVAAPSDAVAPRVQTQTLTPGNLERRRRSSSAVDNRPALTIDSSRAQETFQTVNQRHSSLKSPTVTRAASVGAPPATLPPCPRPVPVGGYNDWYTLYDYPEFKVCPSCREAASEAGYGRHLTAAFTNHPERYVRCSFSVPWIRMAYLLTIKKRRSDANLLYAMADVARETHPCPGNIPSTTQWYRILDIDSDRSVPGFYACPRCVRSLETIFPVLKDVFHKTPANSRYSLDHQTCSLRPESSRFAAYVNLLEDIANQANEYRRAPNTYRFVVLAKTIGVISPCERDTMLGSKAWHVIPRLPEFTACPECYEEVVWPAVLQGLPLAKEFSITPQTIGKSPGVVSCQMYSNKMRKIFKEACEDDDFDYLRKVALKRYRVERDLQAKILEVQRMPRKEREDIMEDIVDEWADWG